MLAAVENRQVNPSTVTPAPDAAMVRRRLAELMERDHWTRRQLLAYQQERLQAVLQHAVATSEYYRETIGHLVDRGAPLEEYPVLTKGQLVANFERIAVCASPMSNTTSRASMLGICYSGNIAPARRAARPACVRSWFTIGQPGNTWLPMPFDPMPWPAHRAKCVALG